jgi:glycine/D-amino acid oxidase-like deaminating enzyme
VKKIAIIGAGLAALGLAYPLLKCPQVKVTLYDPLGPGGGASGISSGMLHPFPGKLAFRSWRAEEGMEATRHLLDEVETLLGRSVAARTGVLRIAIQPSQQHDFRQREGLDAIWWQAEDVIERIPHSIRAPGLWIPSGMTVHSKLYLEGLWRLSLLQGAELRREAIHSLSELDGYDHIVLAAGPGLFRFSECAHLPIEPLKGQLLVCRWSETHKLPFALSSLGHITATEDPTLCQMGSTYERGFSTEIPDEKGTLELIEKGAFFYPPSREFEVLEARSAVRVCRFGGSYRPFAELLTPRLSVFTALGSRGMLYHALLGRELAAKILEVVE